MLTYPGNECSTGADPGFEEGGGGNDVRANV